MNFNKHLELIGKHALFAPSNSAWLRYADDKIVDYYLNRNAKNNGTELHSFASNSILFCSKMPKTRKGVYSEIKQYFIGKYCSNPEADDYESNVIYCKNLLKDILRFPDQMFATITDYINDGIGFLMTPEQPLIYSNIFFGTTDTISFSNNFLRIHDLKTGIMPAHMDQLRIYAALFCLEYKINPADIDIELRIYQNGEILIDNPNKEDLAPIINKILDSNKTVMNLAEDE